MTSIFPKVNLNELCRPTQWPTISQSNLTKDGYPVFGANGRIGYYSEFNHEHPTILITCRGATCGTINVCEPKSYVTGNAMALDAFDISRADLRYTFYALNHRGLRDAITGTAQPQITRTSLAGVKIPLPPLSEQKRIADILDKADAIRRKRQDSTNLTNSLLVAAFYDLFGDPVSNSRNWPTVPLKTYGVVTTGNSPSRKAPENYGTNIEWIKSDNINTPFHYLTRATEGLSEVGKKLARTVQAGATLVTCIAGSPDCVGNAAMADRTVAFNQQINAVTPSTTTDPCFLYMLISLSKPLVQRSSTASMKGMVSKGKFEEVQVIDVPPTAQEDFGRVFKRILKTLDHQHAVAAESESLFNSLVQRAFKGEL